VDLGVSRFDVFLISPGTTRGKEIRKTRPYLIISPDELNRHLHTVIVAPMTTQTRRYPTRVPCQFKGRKGQVVLDQVRTVDRSRLLQKLGSLSPATGRRVLEVLAEIFAP
jgi:mRNA interferase MazF